MINIHNKDCLEAMRSMPDDCFDLAITSPPYNMGLRISKGKYIKRDRKGFSNKYDNFEDNLSIDEFYKFHFSVLNELTRISNLTFYNIAIVTGSKRAFFKLIGDFSNSLKEIIIWDKGNAEPSICRGVLNRQTELILVFSKCSISRSFENANFQKGCLGDLWKIRRDRNKISGHRASFPLSLPIKILSSFGKSGQKVIDPFLGTGTTALACHDMGFDLEGYEIDKEYYEAACQRLADHQQQLRLF